MVVGNVNINGPCADGDWGNGNGWACLKRRYRVQREVSTESSGTPISQT